MTELLDVNFYRTVNADLAGLSNAEATSHFQVYGLNEGRRFSPLIDLDLYRQLNNDLANFGNAELYNHLQGFGISEGRRFSPLVDLSLYRQLNGDLASFNNVELYNHLQNFGISEGREFSPFFDFSFYRATNGDLQGLSNKQLFDHLLVYGLNEERRFSPFADLAYYRSQNPDLGFLIGEQLLDHLVVYGLPEDRRFSQFFEPSYYGINNPDVATAFRVDRETAASNWALLNHFVAFGAEEGRESAPIMWTAYYQASHGDLQSLSGEEAYKHFQLHGALEERSASDLFDVRYYLDNNGDLRNAGLNGFQAIDHYLLNGRREGRFGIPNGSLLTGFEVFSGGLDVSGVQPELQFFNGSLAVTDSLNPDRPGSYADEFALTGYSPGQRVRLTLDAIDDSFDTYLQVINTATGAIIAFNDDSRSGLNSQIIFTPEQGINYVARVTSFTSGEVGDYELVVDEPIVVTGSLTFTDSPNPTRSGALSDDFALTGYSPGQSFEITLNAIDDSFDTYLQIVDAVTGSVITFDDDSGSELNSQLVFTPEQAGNYIVRVTSYDSNALGDYELIVDSDVTVVGNLSPEQTINGALTSEDFTNLTRPNTYRDDYRIRGITAGQQVVLSLNSPSEDDNFDTYLQIINAATGQVVGFDDDSGEGLNSEIRFLAQAETVYIARVTSYSEFDIGSYTLSAAVTTPEIGSDQTIAGILDSSDPLNSFDPSTFSDDYLLTGAIPGQPLRISLDSSSFDTYLYVLNADNPSQIIAANDDANASLNSELTFTPQSGSNYVIRVSSFAPQVTGPYTLTTISEIDWFTNLQDLGLREVARTLADDGVLDRNDMLNLFRDSGLIDGGMIDATEQQDLSTLIDSARRFRMPDYVEFLSQRVVEGTASNASVTAFDANLVQRWFLGQGPLGTPTARFDTRDANGQPITYLLNFTPVQGSLYSDIGRPRIEDIDQGYLGDCAFLAALGGTFQRSREDTAGTVRSPLIEEMIIDNGDNTYTMRFFDNGTPNWVTVDRRLATLNGLLFGARADGSNDPNNSANVLWAPLVERAYAQWREWRSDGEPGFNLIGNGDWPVNPIRYLTGQSASEIQLTPSNQNEIYNTVEAALAGNRSVAGGNFRDNSLFIGGHAYTVADVYVANGQTRVVLRNPWGQDGGSEVRGQDDGYIDVSYNEFSVFYNIGYQVA